MSGAPHDLEIVTPDVDATCALYAAVHGVDFPDPDMMLGGARVADLPGGAKLGVRGPLREDEGPLWRVYLRVDDVDAAVAAAGEAGAQIALEMDLPGDHGRIAIVIAGGVEHGMWQPA